MRAAGREDYGGGGFCNLGWEDAFGKARLAESDRLPPVLMVAGRYLPEEYGSIHYGKATDVRLESRREVDTLLDAVGIIATSTRAFKLLGHPVGLREVVEPRITSMALNTYPIRVSGHPSLCVPCGRGEHGLPIELQLVGRHFDQSTPFRAAERVERGQEAADA